MHTNQLVVNRVLRVQEPSARRLGLDRLDEDKLVLAFARWTDGQIRKWLDYAKGALLFVSLPDDPGSGNFYVYDRSRQTFWMVDVTGTPRNGGYRLEEFEQLAQCHGLKALAQNPQSLLERAWRKPLKTEEVSLNAGRRKQRVCNIG